MKKEKPLSRNPEYQFQDPLISEVIKKFVLTEPTHHERIVAQLLKIEFGEMNKLALALAQQIYEDFRSAGLHTEVGDGIFQYKLLSGNVTNIKEETLVSGGLAWTCKNKLSSFCRLLGNAKFAPRGAVLCNALMTHLGILFATDSNITAARTRTLLEELDLYRMPIGLYNPATDEKGTPESIFPQLFFDMRRSTDPSKGQFEVDMRAHTHMVRLLLQICNEYEPQTVMWDWAQHKITDLKLCASSLEVSRTDRRDFRQVNKTKSD